MRYQSSLGILREVIEWTKIYPMPQPPDDVSARSLLMATASFMTLRLAVPPAMPDGYYYGSEGPGWCDPLHDTDWLDVAYQQRRFFPL